MAKCLFNTASISLILVPFLIEASPQKPDVTSLESIISQVKQLAMTAPREDVDAYSAIVNDLVRIRDRDSWPVVNSSVAISEIRNTKWESEPDESGFRQTIHFSDLGHWRTNPLAHPFAFCWLVESDRLHISHYSRYKDAYNYQIVDKAYQYKIHDDTLTMKTEDRTLTFSRVR